MISANNKWHQTVPSERLGNVNQDIHKIFPIWNNENKKIPTFIFGAPSLDFFICQRFLIERVTVEHKNLKTLLCVAFTENAKLCIVLRSIP